MLNGYIKNTSNCSSLPLGWDRNLEIIEELGGYQAAIVKTGEDMQPRRVVGWTDLFMGRPTSINVYQVRDSHGGKAILICGGNSGIRILANDGDPDFRTEGVDDHLPNGWGMPIMMIQDKNDFVGFED